MNKSMITKNYNEYYDKAFKGDYMSLWMNGPVEVSNADYSEMCYARAMKIFITTDPESINDRKKLFIEYARPNLQSISNEDWYTLKSVLPITTSIPKIQNQRCTLYNDQPQRGYGDQDDLMSEIYSNSDFDLMMPEIYLMAKTCGSVLINPVFLDGKLHLNYLTPDMFRVEVDSANPHKISRVIYPYQPDINKEEIGFYIWSDEWIETWSNGKTIEKIPNYYGEIPFVFLHLGHRDLSVSKLSFGDIGLVQNQLERNLIELLSRHNLIYQGLPTTLVENGGEDFPGHIIAGQVIHKDNTNENNPGTIIEHVAPMAVYDELNSFSKKLFGQELDRYEIPDFNADNLSTALSGISRAMLRQNLIIERKKDLVKLTKCEKELAEIIYLKKCIDSNLNYKEDSLQFSINFAEEQTFNDPVAERAEDKILMEEGIISPLSYYRKWSEIDSNCTEEELIAQLQANFELLDKIKQISNSKPEPEAPIQDVAPVAVPTTPTDAQPEVNSPDEELAQTLEDEQNKIENLN